MKCRSDILQVKWEQFVHNKKITAITSLLSISSIISHCCNAIFSHTALAACMITSHSDVTSI